ncbi:unnamed protein product [Gemmataceae bacterium]|nr:unnamed protein product [Gemmataceae bacterium]VTU02416.1 unnamed protein product [Gemmataceae bacterium]
MKRFEMSMSLMQGKKKIVLTATRIGDDKYRLSLDGGMVHYFTRVDAGIFICDLLPSFLEGIGIHVACEHFSEVEES